MKTKILSIASGKIKNYGTGDNLFTSAYKKDIFYNYIDVNEFGIIDDKQADKNFHGGKDKALHICSNVHFERFEKLNNIKLNRLSFGGNIFIESLDEKDIHIGDIYNIGDIKIEISQPRQACWKVGAIFDKTISRYILKNQATGWYARVLSEGILDINDEMVLENRVSELSIYDLNVYLFTPPNDEALISKILNTKELAQSYKNDFEKIIKKKRGN